MRVCLKIYADLQKIHINATEFPTLKEKPLHFVFYMLCYGLYRLKIVIVRKYYLKNKHIEFDDFGADNCPDLNPPNDMPLNEEDEYLVNEY